MENRDGRYGYCWCGCGQKTKIATKTSAQNGAVKGRPLRYIHNHHGRKSGIDYRVEDRGHDTPCWVWQLTSSFDGTNRYGMVRSEGKMRKAHRVIYERRYGLTPKDMELDHLCRVTLCVNPDHLDPVSHKENVRRGIAAKVTVEQEAQIVALLRDPSKSQSEIALRFGLSQGIVSRIWQEHFDDDRGRLRARLDRVQAEEIVHLKDAGVSQREIARRYGVGESLISRIVNRHW